MTKLHDLKRYISRLLCAFSCVALMAACGGSNDGPEPPESSAGDASRTVLVYMLASSNGLGATSPLDYDIQDIDEMFTAAKAGDLGEGRLLVFHSASNGNQVLKEITPSGIDTLKVYDPTVFPQTSPRMGEVFDDMKELAPAGDYGLVLWGHGTGWLQDGITETEMSEVKMYSYGWEHKSSQAMNVTTLAANLEGRGFSFLYFDCCYMASVEVAYQLRHAVDKIVAYPSEVLALGMPYDRNLKCLFNSEPDLVGAAKNTMDFYNAMLEDSYRMCTISVINTGGMDRLASATAHIYGINTTGLPAGYTPQPYEMGSVCNYYDFASYVRALDSDVELLEEFESALADVVVYEDATEYLWGRLPLNEHSGLSTFIMKNDGDLSKKNYSQLDWYADVASNLIK